MKVETPALRVPAGFKGLQDNLGKLERGAVPEQMGPEGCPESPVARATEVLMDFLDCLVRRDTGASQGRWDPKEPPERTVREARMERSGPGD